MSTLKQWFHTTLAATGETGRYERYRRALIAPGFAGVKETTVEYRSELDLGSLVGIVYSTMPTEAMPAPPQRATFAGRWRRRPASPRA